MVQHEEINSCPSTKTSEFVADNGPSYSILWPHDDAGRIEEFEEPVDDGFDIRVFNVFVVYSVHLGRAERNGDCGRTRTSTRSISTNPFSGVTSP